MKALVLILFCSTICIHALAEETVEASEEQWQDKQEQIVLRGERLAEQAQRLADLKELNAESSR